MHTCKVLPNKHDSQDHVYFSSKNGKHYCGYRLARPASYTNRFHPFRHTARFTPIIIPWATIEHMNHAIISNFQQNQQSRFIPLYIQLQCRICNLTTKITIWGCTEISYNHSQETIDKLIETLSASFNTDTTTLRITLIPPT